MASGAPLAGKQAAMGDTVAAQLQQMRSEAPEPQSEPEAFGPLPGEDLEALSEGDEWTESPAPEPGALEQDVAAQFQDTQRAARFRRPPEPEFSTTPVDRMEIRNSNLPLTVGLLFSVLASFMVFFVGLFGGTGGNDPFMESFWRSLAALAVFTTLSFVASWFMPAPSQRHVLLDKLQHEDELFASGLEPEPLQTEGDEQLEDAEAADVAKGQGVDITLDDEGSEDFGLDEFEEEEPSPELRAARQAVGG